MILKYLKNNVMNNQNFYFLCDFFRMQLNFYHLMRVLKYTLIYLLKFPKMLYNNDIVARLHVLWGWFESMYAPLEKYKN